MNENTSNLENQQENDITTETVLPADNDTDRASVQEADGVKIKKKRKLTRSDKIIIAIFNPLLALIIAFFAVIFPMLRDNSVIFKEDAVYGNVFVAALGDKYQRLLATDNKKIVVVGGSSVAFGLDSAALSQKTGMDVVNFGLYATLGSKVMLDLSEYGVNAGDVVIFAPELDAQTMSLYFGAKSAWQAIDADNSLYDSIKERNGDDLKAVKDEFIEEKKEYLADGAPNPSGVYNRASFNSYGDVSYSRPYNVMTLGYDPNTIFDLNPESFSRDFIEYFNSYCERMREAGVTVYFSYCPINSLSLAEGTDAAALEALDLFFHENLNCPVISNIEDYVMDWGYFYDTNLHLNDAGVIARTERLANDIRAAHKLGGEITMNVPEPPGIDPSLGSFDEGDNMHADLFIYADETMPDGTVVGVKIVGLSEAGIAFTGDEVTIPSTYNDLRVIRISAGSLEGLNASTLHIGSGMSYVDDEAFRGTELKRVYIEFDTKCTVSTPTEDEKKAEDGFGFMKGAPADCKIVCNEEYRNDFRTDYTWSHYYRYFEQ